ncbi:MAG: type IV secretory system conjugative DNA transfer family protein [Cyanobacteria bacterium P01_A01_bin.123]
MTSLDKLHPSEFSAYLYHRWRSSLIMWLATALGLALGIGSLLIDDYERKHFHWLRTGLITGAIGAVAVGRLASENMVQSARIALDHEDISSASRQQRLYESMKPQAESALMIELPEQPYEPEQLNWGALVTEARKHPHIMLLGETGSGKTSLVEALLSLMPGEKVVVHPHYQHSDIPGERADFDFADRIIGGGRNFPEIETYMGELFQEFDERTKLSKSQIRTKSRITVLIDELPAIAKNCSDQVIEQIISLLLESRKYGIRLVLLAQSDSVKTLNIEGQGDAVREQVTYVRLGTYATEHCKSLVSKKRLEESALQWLEQWEYPCMVEDQPGRVPIIANGQFVGLFSNAESAYSADEIGQNGHGAPDGALTVQSAPVHRGRAPVHRPGAPFLGKEYNGAPSDGAPPPFDPLDPQIKPDEWTMVQALKQQGLNQSAIIKKVWGAYRSGKNPAYAAARQKYQTIINQSGLS